MVEKITLEQFNKMALPQNKTVDIIVEKNHIYRADLTEKKELLLKDMCGDKLYLNYGN